MTSIDKIGETALVGLSWAATLAATAFVGLLAFDHFFLGLLELGR